MAQDRDIEIRVSAPDAGAINNSLTLMLWAGPWETFEELEAGLGASQAEGEVLQKRFLAVARDDELRAAGGTKSVPVTRRELGVARKAVELILSGRYYAEVEWPAVVGVGTAELQDLHCRLELLGR